MFTQSSWVRDLYSFIKMRSAIARPSGEVRVPPGMYQVGEVESRMW